MQRDQDQNDESALKVGPNHQCLQPHVQQYCFSKSAVKTSVRRDGQPNWSKYRWNRSGMG